MSSARRSRAALDAMVARSVANIVQGGPVALAETKGLLRTLAALAPPGYAEVGAAAFGRTAAGAEAAEGIAAFREKRAAAWTR